jgi:hypothetical protein
MKTIKLIFLFSSIALIAWSCSDSTFPNSNSEGFASAPYANATKISVGGTNNPNQADSSNQLNKLIPGFGGLFINKSGKFTIYLTHPATQKAKAKEVLSNSKPITKALARLRAQGGKYQSASIVNMVVKKGRYTFLQLYSWDHETGKIRVMDGVYAEGIDQSKNKVSIGVKNKAVKTKVINKLAQLNIPKDAVAIYQMSKPEFY